MNDTDPAHDPDDLTGWTPPEPPAMTVLQGRTCRLEPMDPDRHAAALHAAFSAEPDEAQQWFFLPYGPFESEEVFTGWLRTYGASDGRMFFAIVDQATDRPIGEASFQNVVTRNGTIEIGNVRFSAAMQRSVAATEAIFLLMRHAFYSGYRRLEWKTHAGNTRSRRAAHRFGLSWEGRFRNHMISRGRSRDTVWFACTDRDWQVLEPAFTAWLDPENFDEHGNQRRSLGVLTRPVLVALDPEQTSG